MFKWFKKAPEIPAPIILEVPKDGRVRCEDCGKDLSNEVPLTSPDSDIRGKTRTESNMTVGIPTIVCKLCWYKNFKKMHPDIEPAYYV